MRVAKRSDKDLVLNILTDSFLDNKSVNYLIPKDHKHKDRVRALMDYSFETCFAFGKVLISDNSDAIALISFPENKKTTLQSLLWEAKLVLNGIGIGNVSKAMAREKAISQNYPQTPIYYLWFIAVNPQQQGKGIGTKFLSEIRNDAAAMKRPIYLETSTIRNLPFYKNAGLGEYGTLDFGYKLYLIRSMVDADREH
ncbi:GNAT family N-acetyltransferase [Dyadobacter alkalitolerans]|uniref:GNAT family N-acetyltransferase n=1 Tax=Dyadobacter alkalitolerans TaxID=492736 RepID=UPI000423A1B5|nr:GNAT family N-acetyltransferase [Dyadobacter alkalitolerans]